MATADGMAVADAGAVAAAAPSAAVSAISADGRYRGKYRHIAAKAAFARSAT